MPAYLVQLPATAQATLIQGADSLVVFAGSSAEAKDMAKAHFDGDGDAQWAAATVTEIVAAADWSAFELYIAIYDHSTPIEVTALPAGLAVTGGAITVAGSGYAENDILTIAGGTSTRAATFRVTSVGGSGEVTGIEVVDPGEYTVTPGGAARATTASPPGGTACTITPTASTNAFESMLANAVSLLNANASIAGAAIDMGAGAAPLLTIASGGGGDDLGDENLVVEMRYVNGTNKTPIAALVGTITDGGLSSAALSAAFNAAPIAPNVLAALKS